ncbi:hypothetical protein QNZ80_004664 [Vibrio parahaemolyticus]|nr:hypothetical protein [Vibrio parahaemolyticus]ELB2189820.1 hypothetical protein [Vibrio parahaemolyticus]ELB2194936.1 hypothetical protein [Vibrio parahaemolyticus]ELB2215025.1 hypothetical protein [Vibrio parahaemolyticus]ELB2234763.1 hypothetical protein [Vibrio parahaemolyticus]
MIAPLIFVLFIVFKARVSVYHNTLDNGVLTYVSAFLAVSLTAILYIYKIRRVKRAENIIVEHGKYGKSPKSAIRLLPILVIPLFILIRVGISISNERYVGDDVVKINFTVTCKGERSVKGGRIKYLCINDGERELKYDSNDIASHYFSIGEEIIVTARRGYWGYLVIQDLHKKKTRKALDAKAVTCPGLSASECARYFAP